MKNITLKFVVSSLVLLGALSVGTAAFAQEALPQAGEAMGSATASQGNVVYQKETVYDFDSDDVEGSIVRPDEANITGEQHGKSSSLIQIRTDFIPELIRSVERI